MKHFAILQKNHFYQPPKHLVRTSSIFILSFLSQKHDVQDSPLPGGSLGGAEPTRVVPPLWHPGSLRAAGMAGWALAQHVS